MLAYLGCIPGVERRGPRIPVLTALVLVGGLSRLAGWFIAGDPNSMRWALITELAVAPAVRQ